MFYIGPHLSLLLAHICNSLSILFMYLICRNYSFSFAYRRHVSSNHLMSFIRLYLIFLSMFSHHPFSAVGFFFIGLNLVFLHTYRCHPLSVFLAFLLSCNSTPFLPTDVKHSVFSWSGFIAWLIFRLHINTMYSVLCGPLFSAWLLSSSFLCDIISSASIAFLWCLSGVNFFCKVITFSFLLHAL